jgi:iron complex outermembrane receptor protein
LAGVRLNTAAPQVDGQTGLMVNAQHLQTNGALANNDGRRDDVLLKSESMFSGLRLTLLYSYDDYHFINPPSVTTDQLAAQGSGAGLTTSPGSPLYNQYAKTDRNADFAYARLRGQLTGSLGFSETLYTYSYVNTGLSVNGDVTLPSSYQVGKGFGVEPTDVAGRLSHTRYRTVGNILRFDQQMAANNIFRAGLWLEHTRQAATRNAEDLSTGATYAANKTAQTSALYDYDATLDTVQPFVESEWKPLPTLAVDAGLRYQTVKRGFSATVVPNSRPGTAGEINRTAHAVLPSLEGNYAFTAGTHGYLQWARGSLVPSQAFFYTNNPVLGNQAKPQSSQSFQAGVIYAAGPVSFTADAYRVDLRNYISTTTDANKNTVFLNNGRVGYRGLEAEGDVDVGFGWTVVGNASLVRAQFRDPGLVSRAQQTGDTIALAPKYVGLLGALYKSGPWSGSVLAKFVGTEFQGPGGSSDGSDRRVAAYSYTNLTAARRLDEWTGRHHAVLGLEINNVFNQTPITDSAGRGAVGPSGPLLVNVLARRNYMVSFRCDL